MPAPLITSAEIATPRTADELFEWLRVDVYDRIGRARGGKKRFRAPESRWLREVRNEVWPLSSYAKRYYSGRGDVLFEPVPGDQQPFDARILDRDSGRVLHQVEITTALHGGAGYQERLQMERLNQLGDAPLTDLDLSRDNATGGIVQGRERVAIERGAGQAAEFARVQAAVRQKAAKRYATGTILVVEFDTPHVRSGDDPVVKEWARQLWPEARRTFAELALVDGVGEICARHAAWIL